MCLKAAVERRAPEGVRLELFKPDKPGLLAQVTRTFRENAMNVTQAEISTTMGMAVNIFYVTDAIGNLVLLGHYCLIMELMLILGIIVVMLFFGVFCGFRLLHCYLIMELMLILGIIVVR
ncbi:putative ACT domain-containing protein ACR1-12 [Helianthus annuus]|nr:putative ACT domain-containing protein ACR1-12 [Helianthus annuus]KAJ0829822.1 putative ACT domain-containing protein ACR1-12 [Helianthus annuus]